MLKFLLVFKAALGAGTPQIQHGKAAMATLCSDLIARGSNKKGDPVQLHETEVMRMYAWMVPTEWTDDIDRIINSCSRSKMSGGPSLLALPPISSGAQTSTGASNAPKKSVCDVIDNQVALVQSMVSSAGASSSSSGSKPTSNEGGKANAKAAGGKVNRKEALLALFASKGKF